MTATPQPPEDPLQLRAFREHLSLSQAQFARKLGISKQSVWRAEHGGMTTMLHVFLPSAAAWPKEYRSSEYGRRLSEALGYASPDDAIAAALAEAPSQSPAAMAQQMRADRGQPYHQPDPDVGVMRRIRDLEHRVEALEHTLMDLGYILSSLGRPGWRSRGGAY